MNHFSQIAARLEQYDLDAVLLTEEANRFYASGFHSAGTDGAAMHAGCRASEGVRQPGACCQPENLRGYARPQRERTASSMRRALRSAPPSRGVSQS